MPTVNFYLKKPKSKKDSSLIYLKMKYSGEVFVYTFKQKIHSSNWNDKKQRAKSNRETTADGQHSINELLDNLERVCLKAYNDNLKNGLPSKATLKDALDAFFYRNIREDENASDKSLMALIERFIAGEIKHRGKNKTERTLANYKSTKAHLLNYGIKYRVPVDFDTITLDFFYSFVSYLEKHLKLSNNTVSKYIRTLKVFMNEAVDLGWTNNVEFRKKKFTKPEEDVESIYLRNDEILQMFNHDLSGNRKLEQVRDMFVVGCFTGLRFSDFSNIRLEHIVKEGEETFIKMFTQKTREEVIIPTNPVILKIFDKYNLNNNRMPRSISNQKFNDYIKDVCRVAGLTVKGRVSKQPGVELCDLVSSHTARRSFATNTYLSGFPTIELMKVTGHKTEKSFLKYIKVDKLSTAKRLSEHNKKYWSALLMKMAI